MTSAELARLIEAAAEPYRTMFTLMATTGLRPGEAYGLQPGDLDLAAATMRVERSVSIHDQTIKGTKTDEERTVELSEKTTSMLKTHLWLHDTASVRPGISSPARRGRFSTTTTWRSIPRSSATSAFTIFHTYGALMLSAGAPLLYVSEQLGHADASITLKYYAKRMPRSEDRQVNRWDLEPIWNQSPQVGEPRRNRTVNLRIKSRAQVSANQHERRLTDISGLLRQTSFLISSKLRVHRES